MRVALIAAALAAVFAVPSSAVGSKDRKPPSMPKGLTATAVSSTRIDLAWRPSKDNVGVAGYRIYRGGVQIATATGATYSATGLDASTGYSFAVAAYDLAGNVSRPSAPAAAQT